MARAKRKRPDFWKDTTQRDVNRMRSCIHCEARALGYKSKRCMLCLYCEEKPNFVMHKDYEVLQK